MTSAAPHSTTTVPDAARLNAHLDFLLSVVYENFLDPEHLADLHRSGLSNETIRRQKIRTVPPHMIDQLLAFPAPKVTSAYLIPFADPLGGWMDHVRMKVFPSYADTKGRTVKYLGPRGAAPRLFFPLATLDAVLEGDVPIYIVEGGKKSLAVAQLGLPALGFEGIEGWHVGGSRALLPDFDAVKLRGRTIELVPDGDARTNPNVERGALRFAEAIERRGARVRLVTLPVEVAA
jgi:hypothetical protein